MAADRVRIGVIGCGYWATNLIRNFHKIMECTVVEVADLDPQRLDVIRMAYPHVETTRDAAHTLTRPDIDAVTVVTPISTHYALAKAALEHGKHVLVEKPMAETTVQARELAALAQRRERVLMVDHTFVYTGAVRKIRELIAGDELGSILYVDSVRVNLGLFQRDTNVLWDLAPHDFAILDFLLARTPRAVVASGASPVQYTDRPLESIVYVTVDYGDNLLAHLHLSWLSPLKIRRMLIGGSRRMVVYDHLDTDNQVKIYDNEVDFAATEARDRILAQRRLGDMYAPKVDQTEALEHVCRHFLESIREGAKPVTDSEAGIRVVRLLEAAQESMRNGGMVVEV